jgi:regulator of sigma E protease
MRRGGVERVSCRALEGTSVTLTWMSLPGFLVLVCVLVTVHEFGHYWVARRLGFKVLRFSVGFGRALMTRIAGPDRTEYVLAVVPLGGYVKLLDERDGPVPAEELPRSFTRRPHWQRIVVLLAGPAFNFIFAILLLFGMLLVSGSTEFQPLLGPVRADSPAARAGIRSGDEIVAVNGHAVSTQREVWIGLLDGVTGGEALSVTVRDAAGHERRARIDFASAAERRAVSEPAVAFEGLGLQFQDLPIPALLGTVASDGPAAQAGLKAGDEILSVNGEPVHDFAALVAIVRAHPDVTLAVQYRRAGLEGTARVAVGSASEGGKRIGRILVSGPRLSSLPPGGMVRHVDLGPLGALSGACREAWGMTAFQARMLWRMLAGQVSVKNLGGPIAIAQMAGDAAAAGVGQFLQLMVVISLLLGFMNLLPIPILDGGQILMQAIEWLKGSPLSERVQLAGQQLGIVLVLLLLGLALYNDISRQFG